MEQKLPAAFAALRTCLKLDFAKIRSCLMDAGPGSFTGLRLGFSFAKGLFAPYDVSFFCLSSLDLLALQVQMQGSFATVRDAKRGRIYYAIYTLCSKNHLPVRKSEPTMISLSAFREEVAKSISYILTDDSELREKLRSTAPLMVCPFSPCATLFSWPVKETPRLQLRPLYLQSFP